MSLSFFAPHQNKINMEKNENFDLSKMFEPVSYFQPNAYFYAKHGEIPSKSLYLQINHNFALAAIEGNLEYENKFGIREYYKSDKVSTLRSYVVEFDTKIVVFFNPGLNGPERVEVLYSKDSDMKKVKEIEELIFANKKKEKISSKIHLVTKHRLGGLDLTSLSIKECDNNLSMNYNDDFLPINTTICERLNTKDDSGLVLLHGKPGTGKTSYIRSLTKQLNKRLIFLPPDLAHEIATPAFLTFLLHYPNSVLIIEDAETIIQERRSGGSGVVSNLLNMTDGLLSDCLKIQIICSFNSQINKIDPALLRKGRLIALYEFKELEKSKARKLSDSLGYVSAIERDMTLSEIYNQSKEDFSQPERKSVGF